MYVISNFGIIIIIIPSTGRAERKKDSRKVRTGIK